MPEFDDPHRTLSWTNPPASDIDNPGHELVFSPNGQRLAYFSPWLQTDRLRDLELVHGRIENIPAANRRRRTWGVSAFSGDSKYLVVRTGPRKMLLWDAEAGASYREITLPDRTISEPAFSPREALMAVVFDTSAEVRGVVWDYAANRERAVLRTPFHLSSVAFDHQGKYLAAGGEDGIVVYDASTFAEVLQFRGVVRGVDGLRWTSDDRHLIWRNLMGTLQIREIALTIPHHALSIDAGPDSELAFSPDGKWLGVGSREEVRVVDRRTGETRYELSPGGVFVFSAR